MNNLITEARTASLKQSVNKNRFSSLRLVFSTAKIVQKKKKQQERGYNVLKVLTKVDGQAGPWKPHLNHCALSGKRVHTDITH